MGRSRIPGAGIDLAKTLECGQVFHWTRCEAGFVGTIGETPSYLEQVDGDLIVPEGQETLVHHYHAWEHAAVRTPHGTPIELMPEDFRS